VSALKLTEAQRCALNALERNGWANPMSDYDQRVLVERGLAFFVDDEQWIAITDAGRAALRGES
jgi:hypothetical protein